MADLSYDDVRKIIAILDASTLDEIHVELGDFKLDVRRRTAGSPAPAAPAATIPTAPSPAPAPAPAAASSQPERSKDGAGLKPGQFAVTAPMLGTFYRAPAPDAPPFADVGRVVEADDPLCIIEVMKLMNTIKAERRGRVAAILAENATMVEFGQTLIVFDPI
ncbi:MAG: acetyl-CoA carboxylase biotin carboxyl carrier protein [Vulcanimicrobiaceae bacterium]